jgi:hypothetical protein
MLQFVAAMQLNSPLDLAQGRAARDHAINAGTATIASFQS